MKPDQGELAAPHRRQIVSAAWRQPRRGYSMQPFAIQTETDRSQVVPVIAIILLGLLFAILELLG